MPRIFVGVTDNDWFDFLAARTDVDEVNFWQPSGQSQFRALQPGDLFLFKLKGERNAIAGGGWFVWSTLMPLSYAWSAFAEKNGAPSLDALRPKLVSLRTDAEIGQDDFQIGCILLARPFFFPESQWIEVPPSFSRNIVVGKTYDTSEPDGKRLWDAVHYQLAGRDLDSLLVDHTADRDPRLAWVQMRPGQGIFRSMVASAYRWRCAVTGERVLPVLEAAHIKPFGENGPNVVQNGLLLRADLHRLLDAGYVTLSPDYRLEVSRKVKGDYENGREYYSLQGHDVRQGLDELVWPDPEFVAWHREHKYLG